MKDLNLDNNTILLGIVFILGIVIIFCFNNKKESFKKIEGFDTTTEVLQKQLIDKLDSLINNIETKVPKSEYNTMSKTLEALKLFISNQYMLKTAVDNKYVLKSEYDSLKKSSYFDPSKYVLKSSIPPPIKCPPCVCPKVKIEPGLCKKCPPHPPCPQVERCPPITCPAPIPCPQTKCPEVKPTVIKDSMVCPRPYHKHEPGLKLKDLPKPTTKIFVSNRTIQGNVLTPNDIKEILTQIKTAKLKDPDKIKEIIKAKVKAAGIIDEKYVEAATARGVKAVNYVRQFSPSL